MNSALKKILSGVILSFVMRWDVGDVTMDLCM